MEQRTRRLVIFLGGVALASGGLVVAACTTDNGKTPLPTTNAPKDSGGPCNRRDASDPIEEEDGGPEEDDAAAAPDCGFGTPRLRNNDQGFFCPGYTRDAGLSDSGARGNCALDETCCDPFSDNATNFCAATTKAAKGQGDGGQTGQATCAAQAAQYGSTWDGGKTAWECADSKGCAEGHRCCLYTDPFYAQADGGGDKVNIGLTNNEELKACKAQEAYKAGGTRCAPIDSCPTGEIQLCSASDQNCPAPKQCTAFLAPGNRFLGFCK